MNLHLKETEDQQVPETGSIFITPGSPSLRALKPQMKSHHWHLGQMDEITLPRTCHPPTLPQVESLGLHFSQVVEKLACRHVGSSRVQS